MTFIDDAWKAPLWTMPAALDYMRTSIARRKLVVFGTLSDYPGKMSRRYRALAAQALEAVDDVLFVGPNATAVRRLAEASSGRLTHVETIGEARAWLDQTARPGDLVLLEGSTSADHLQRLYLDALESIGCWTDACRRLRPCRTCPDRAHGPEMP